MDMDSPAEVEKRRKAREKKSTENKKKWALEKKEATKVTRDPRSTAVGQKQRMIELREKLLSEGNTANVLRKILEVAYNDEHPGQMQALKLCFDRMLPQSMFDDKSKMDKPVISINISGINDVQVEGSTVDGEFDVSEDDNDRK